MVPIKSFCTHTTGSPVAKTRRLKRDSNDMRRRLEVRRTPTHVIPPKTPNTRYPSGQCTFRPFVLMARYVFSETTHFPGQATTCACYHSLTFPALCHSRHVGATPCIQGFFCFVYRYSIGRYESDIPLSKTTIYKNTWLINCHEYCVTVELSVYNRH